MNSKQGRFIFHNPHHFFWFKKPSRWPIGKKGAQKYTYIFDYFLAANEKVSVYIDEYRDKGPWYEFRNYLHPAIGFYAWVLRNKMNPLRFNLILNPKKITEKDRIFIFLYGTFTNESGVLSKRRIASNAILEKSKACKIVHMTHYMYNADIASRNLKKINPDLLIAENNLKKNDRFFQKHFDWYKKDFYLLPFVPNMKFENYKKYSERENKAFAMGTIVEPLTSKVFNEFFKSGNLQPMRLKIYEENKPDYIYSIISPINHPSEKGRPGQKNYFKHNIIELYNKYKMFIVPEEVSGFPGVGFVEGMRCGSAFIGINNDMYKDIGMIPGKDYIDYDGSYGNLIEKISYYQKNNKELEEIAISGYKFACEELNSAIVLSRFIEYLDTISS